MDTQDTLTALSALAHENRLAIFRRLVVAGDAGMTPGGLGAALGLAPATLSFHLKELMHAGLLRKRQQGRFIHYQANFTAIDGLIAYLTENCCQGGSCDITAGAHPAIPPGDTL
ncbi:ArsR/SmtB family transcription factor [Acidihalobacter ferrooxydans]|uniref:Transcriptional regulator n=1 Tax=Acidihalobacter ferrooxydans TaxID=1765967 RepID=A0A1P8UDV4_9GAMM|nr:metalloregulator ArsR/SmtB family transcription factor [Acidihalobacter ferrooxydans]APZ42003.1 transcriptional regulator [Acidihalobacter ferrooxydans]